jgi:osmotically-inducible protein OsmY
MLMCSPNVCAVTKTARDRLRRDFFTNVSCDCRDGTLYLRGQTHSFYRKQLAQEAVRRLDGVVTVVNKIEVDS